MAKVLFRLFLLTDEEQLQGPTGIGAAVQKMAQEHQAYASFNAIHLTDEQASQEPQAVLTQAMLVAFSDEGE